MRRRRWKGLAGASFRNGRKHTQEINETQRGWASDHSGFIRLDRRVQHPDPLLQPHKRLKPKRVMVRSRLDMKTETAGCDSRPAIESTLAPLGAELRLTFALFPPMWLPQGAAPFCRAERRF